MGKRNEDDEDEQAEKGTTKELLGSRATARGELRDASEQWQSQVENFSGKARLALPRTPGLLLHSHDPPPLESDHSHNSSCRGLLKGLHELVQVDCLNFPGIK